MANTFPNPETYNFVINLQNLVDAYTLYKAQVNKTSGLSDFPGAITTAETLITSELTGFEAYRASFPSAATTDTYISDIKKLVAGVFEHGMIGLITDETLNATYKTEALGGVFVRNLAMVEFAIPVVDEATDSAAILAAFTNDTDRLNYMNKLNAYVLERITAVNRMTTFRQDLKD